ncbi:MAG: hypothetical protein ACE5KE_11680, partial [Methanosarcinales archaeon]
VYAKNLNTGKIINVTKETLTMHTFSEDEWTVSWNTSELAGLYEFVVFADSEDVIIETNEYNNNVSRKVYVNANPKIDYLYSKDLQGYNEDLPINALVIDEDNNLENISLEVTKPDNNTEILNLTNISNIFSSIYKDSIRGRYYLNISARDELGLNTSSESYFDLFDSLYLNLKTTKDTYYYAEKVKLTPSKSSNLTKMVKNTKPILFSAFDKVEIVKGGSRITVRANAYDPDGDLINLYVCKGNSTVSSSGCGSDGEYGNSSSKINPRVSFNVENDNNEHKWYAYIFDQNGEGALNNGLEGNYTTDSTPPKTEIVSFASGLEQPYVDLQDDNKTLVVIKGEEGMKVRWGKDTRYRLHKDRSYNYLINNCNVSGEYAICNLGNIKKDDKSIDRITNLTYVYISAVDRYGNSQNNSENLNIAFSLELNTSIYDDYDGRILAKGENVFINGDTKYCIDQAGKCPPNLEINNNSIQFNESGIYHLRYYDYYAKIKDTLVFVNTPPNISNQTYIDHLGVHAFEVRVDVLDKDNQDLNCSLHTDTSVIPMTVENVKAYATLYSSNVSTISTFVSCGDGFEEVNTKTANHTFPNVAPILKNIPDISLNKNGSTAIDLSYLAKDLEGDNLNYSIVNQSNETIAKASI